MQTFNHFIITRFNVRVTFAEPGTGLDPAWLSHRFKLFDHFCYPSVRGQSNLNFQWLVLFDSDTPSLFKEKVTEYSQWSHFIPVYIAENDQRRKITRRAIADHVTGGPDCIATTRLDSDDAIHRDFIQILHDILSSQLENGKTEFINFTCGYILHKSKLYLTEKRSNPFISFVEKADGFRTVYPGVGHEQLATVAPIREIMTAPLWLQVVHERNVSNRVQGTRKRIKALHDFAIDPEYIPIHNDLLSCWLERGGRILRRIAGKAFRTKGM